MTKDEAFNTAKNNFLNGYNCSQSVLLTFADELGFNKEQALKLSQGFGGGMCRLRETCGCVTGMIMALGFVEGSSDSHDKAAKDNLYKDGQELVKKYQEINGSFLCKELLGLVPKGSTSTFLNKNTVSGDASVPVSEERTQEYYKKRPCPELCGIAASIFQEYLDSRK